MIYLREIHAVLRLLSVRITDWAHLWINLKLNKPCDPQQQLIEPLWNVSDLHPDLVYRLIFWDNWRVDPLRYRVYNVTSSEPNSPRNFNDYSGLPRLRNVLSALRNWCDAAVSLMGRDIMYYVLETDVPVVGWLNGSELMIISAIITEYGTQYLGVRGGNSYAPFIACKAKIELMITSAINFMYAEFLSTVEWGGVPQWTPPRQSQN